MHLDIILLTVLAGLGLAPLSAPIIFRSPLYRRRRPILIAA